MEESIFAKIIRGEIPCSKVYEDDKTFVFMDIHPKTAGHVLVIPKQQVEFIWDLDDETYQAVMATVKKVGLRIRQVLNPKYVGMLVVGDEVPHAHVHVYPFNTKAESQSIPDQTAEPDYAALAAIAERLAF